MGEEEPDEDRSSLRGNPMTILNLFKKGGHGTSLFCFWFFLFLWFLGLSKQTKQIDHSHVATRKG